MVSANIYFSLGLKCDRQLLFFMEVAMEPLRITRLE